MPVPKDPVAFTDAMADILRLPDETLAMTYLYTNKYKRATASSEDPDPLDPLTSSPSLHQTLALACLSLASKSTESPRRLRELLFPAHRLLQPSAEPLRAPSAVYDTLRVTLVQAELMLLRVLGFNLRISLPLDFLPRYLERAMADVIDAGENYDDWGKEERDEYGVLGGIMETGLGRACKRRVIDACKDFGIANFFPARAVAVGCLWVILEERGLEVGGSMGQWVKDVTSRKVDGEDFEEVVSALKTQHGIPSQD